MVSKKTREKKIDKSNDLRVDFKMKKLNRVSLNVYGAFELAKNDEMNSHKRVEIGN